MSRLAVLLRAVNVGGRGKLTMADFKACLAELGHEAAITLGAAGSAVVSPTGEPRAIEAAVEQALKQGFDLSTAVLARDRSGLRATLEGNPFAAMAEDAPSHLLVMFLKGQPDTEAVEALRARISGPEEVAAGPECLYAAYPAGMGRSKLTGQVIEKTLRLQGTGRNWNTVTKLVQLTQA